MNFEFSVLQNDIRRGVREICERYDVEYWRKRDEANEYPEEDRVYSYSGTIHRYGRDALFLNVDQLENGEPSYLGSQIYFGDMYGYHYGDFWVNEGQRDAGCFYGGLAESRI